RWRCSSCRGRFPQTWSSFWSHPLQRDRPHPDEAFLAHDDRLEHALDDQNPLAFLILSAEGGDRHARIEFQSFDVHQAQVRGLEGFFEPLQKPVVLTPVSILLTGIEILQNAFKETAKAPGF